MKKLINWLLGVNSEREMELELFEIHIRSHARCIELGANPYVVQVEVCDFHWDYKDGKNVCTISWCVHSQFFRNSLRGFDCELTLASLVLFGEHVEAVISNVELDFATSNTDLLPFEG